MMKRPRKAGLRGKVRVKRYLGYQHLAHCQIRHRVFQPNTDRGFSLLFKMNTLFEEYIGRLAERALIGSDLRVIRQGGPLFCLTDEKIGRGVFQTRPDIITDVPPDQIPFFCSL